MFKILDGGIMPTRGSKYSAFVDVYANEDVIIRAGETKLIKLGIAIDKSELESCVIGYETPNDTKELILEDFLSSHYLQLAFRSSNAKKGLIMPTGFGVIDLDYEDEIMLPVHNAVSNKTLLEVYKSYAHCNHKHYKIKKGDRIGQITLVEHKSYLMGIDTEEKRTGGFGSTK